MPRHPFALVAAILAVAFSTPSYSATITFSSPATDITRSGVTMTISTVGGALRQSVGTVAVGGFRGSGTYTLSFSQPIDLLQMGILSLQDFGVPRKAILDFLGDGKPVAVSYENALNSVLDGGIIYPTGANGRGTIVWTSGGEGGPPIQAFTFTHTQSDTFEFLLDFVVVNTVDPPPTANIPEPSSALILAGGLGLLAWRRSRHL
jgi:hypothetical protein